MGRTSVVSGLLMKVLLAEYIIICGVSAAEGNWARVLYWGSAAGITAAVLWMSGGK